MRMSGDVASPAVLVWAYAFLLADFPPFLQDIPCLLGRGMVSPEKNKILVKSRSRGSFKPQVIEVWIRDQQQSASIAYNPWNTLAAK